MAILKVFIVILLVLFPLGEFARLVFSDNVTFTVNDIAVGVVAITGAVLLRKSIVKQTLFKPVLFFALVCLVSLIVNVFSYQTKELFVGSLYLLRWISYALLYFIVSTFDKRTKNRLIGLLFAVGFVVVGVGYLQYFYYPNLRNLFYQGWDDHLFRMFSTFLDPNFAGAFFALFLLMLLGYFFYTLQKKSWVALPIGLSVLVTISALFLTHSRSALLMFIVSSIVLFGFLQKKRWLLGVVLAIGLSILFSSRYYYLENINLFRTVSSEARFETARNALQIFVQHPIIGVGFNTYRYAQVQSGFRTVSGAQTSHADAGVDNSFLFILATTGIVGFFAYGYLLFCVFRAMIVVHRQTKPTDIYYYLSAVSIASFVGILVSSLFINSLFYIFVMEWMWILLGITEKK